VAKLRRRLARAIDRHLPTGWIKHWQLETDLTAFHVNRSLLDLGAAGGGIVPLQSQIRQTYGGDIGAALSDAAEPMFHRILNLRSIVSRADKGNHRNPATVNSTGFPRGVRNWHNRSCPFASFARCCGARPRRSSVTDRLTPSSVRRLRPCNSTCAGCPRRACSGHCPRRSMRRIGANCARR
jgi:hypothetical protein